MRELNQYVVYRVDDRGNGKTDKKPLNIHGDVCNALDSTNWTSYQNAKNHADIFKLENGGMYGPGLVLTKNDQYYCIDIDDCITDGKYSDIAIQLLTLHTGAYVEISQSGRGLHIIGRYLGEIPPHKCKNAKYGIECYTHSRVISLTHYNAIGDATFDGTNALITTINSYFEAEEQSVVVSQWTTTHHPTAKPIEDDQELINKMLSGTRMASVFGNKISPQQLWTADAVALRNAFPAENDHGYDASSADASLCSHLLFYTGGNCERTLNLLWQSGLVRDKWKTNTQYLSRTVLSMHIGGNSSYYGASSINDNKDDINENIANLSEYTLEVRGEYEFMPIEAQKTYFHGCVYITDEKKILCPNLALLDKDQFNVMYGGYIFNVDVSGEKHTELAWNAFTLSRAYKFPKVFTTHYTPKLNTFDIVTINGHKAINIFKEPEVKSIKGDTSPFEEHVRRLLPIERDRKILFSYLAACVQNKGIKFRWAPVLQGVEGNGKTVIMDCMFYAMGGEGYVHTVRPEHMDEKYNKWLFQNLFILVEEISTRGRKSNLLNVLKPMITNNYYEVRSMRSDQQVKNLCCNFMFTTNHKGELEVTESSRRYSIFYTAQQSTDDLITSGLTEAYFQQLHHWLDNEDGYAIVAYYLENYHVEDEFNPMYTARAPETSSTSDAIEDGRNMVQQLILENVEMGIPGFANGWISSHRISSLIERHRLDSAYPLRTRSQLLDALGYIPHPHLRRGRATKPTALDGRKITLYVHKQRDDLCAITDPAEIVDCYDAAQGDPRHEAAFANH